MDISQFSKRCVYIAPVKNDRVLSHTQQEEIKETLEKHFTKLKNSGIEVVLCIGGMNLDYERYDVSHIIPCVMVYHTTFNYYEEIPELYETSVETVQSELAFMQNRYTFLETLIYDDAYKEELAEMQKLSGYSLHIGNMDIEVQPKLLDKYNGVNLLIQWLKEQKVLATFANHKQMKELKRPFDTNKVGLKCDINQNGTKYYLCNNLTREDIIFR